MSDTTSATLSTSMTSTPITTSNIISMSIINRQSLISKVFSRHLHSPGSHQSTRFLESVSDWLTLSLQERLVTLKIRAAVVCYSIGKTMNLDQRVQNSTIWDTSGRERAGERFRVARGSQILAIFASSTAFCIVVSQWHALTRNGRHWILPLIFFIKLICIRFNGSKSMF